MMKHTIEADEAKPHNYSKPNWFPLEWTMRAAGLPIQACSEFMWMCEEPAGVHQYKHRDTRKYAILRGDFANMSGQRYPLTVAEQNLAVEAVLKARTS